MVGNNVQIIDCACSGKKKFKPENHFVLPAVELRSGRSCSTNKISSDIKNTC